MIFVRSVKPAVCYFLIFFLFNSFFPYGPAAQQSESSTKVLVKTVNCQIVDKKEKVTIMLTHFTVPTIFDLNGKQPRIVIDIMNALPWKGPYKIPVNGKLIRQIRTHFHTASEKVRIVLDLNPSVDYVVTNLTLTKKIEIVLKPVE